jgi:FtsP/CotA-like multicopper oxidase with cupredoxin domain
MSVHADVGGGAIMSLSRRDVLKTGVFAGAAAALPTIRSVSAGWDDGRMAASKLPQPFTVPFSKPPVAVPYRSDATCDYYKMSMIPVLANVLPGYKTPMFAYNGSVPGPTIQVNQGRQVVVRHANNLPAIHPTLGYEPWTSVHLHGSASLPQYDGYASDITHPGYYKDYHYPNFQRARTLWYHDHGVHHTAENVYQGLAAQYHLHDPEELALPIPHGEYDVPLMVSDAMFKSDGSLLFSLADHSGMYGDVILVNGRPWPVMKVKRRKYRFRVLNASISRSYNFSLSTGDSFQVIATDGGMMPAPVTIKNYRHGMAERYEIVIDFAKYQPGQRVVLKNTSPRNNDVYANTDKVMAFDVVGDAFSTENNSVPDQLSAVNDVMNLKASQAVAIRKLRLERVDNAWTINGHTWENVVASGFTFTEAKPRENTVEMWDIENKSGGWFHPLHIHLVDFQVLSRNRRPCLPHERGPKDVVYVGEGETVRVLMKFDACGKYMVHCHNLVHEDHDMMTQFEVVSPDHYGDDPLSAPCKDLSMEAGDVL